MFMYRQIPTSWGRERLSSVRSSLKLLQTLMTSSCDGDSPVLRTWDNSVSLIEIVDGFGRTYLAEELDEFFALSVLSTDGETGLLQRLAQEIADFFPRGAELLRFCVLGALAFIGAGKHIGEELERNWEQ